MGESEVQDALTDILLPFVRNRAAIEHIKLRGNPQIRFAFVSLSPDSQPTIPVIIGALDRTFPFPHSGIITIKRWVNPNANASQSSAPPPPPLYIPPPASAFPPPRHADSFDDDDAQILVSDLPASATEAVVRGFVAQIVAPSAILNVSVRPGGGWDSKVAHVTIESHLDPEQVALQLHHGTYFDRKLSVVALPPRIRSRRDRESANLASSSSSRIKKRTSTSEARSSRSPSPFRAKRRARSRSKDRSHRESGGRGDRDRSRSPSRRHRDEREHREDTLRHSSGSRNESSNRYSSQSFNSRHQPRHEDNDRRHHRASSNPRRASPVASVSSGAGPSVESPSSAHPWLDQETTSAPPRSTSSSQGNPEAPVFAVLPTPIASIAPTAPTATAVPSLPIVTPVIQQIIFEPPAYWTPLLLPATPNVTRTKLVSVKFADAAHYDTFLKLVKDFGEANLGFVEIELGLERGDATLLLDDTARTSEKAAEVEPGREEAAPVAVEEPVKMEVDKVETLGLLGRLKWVVGLGP
ncbi:hypothetical protein RQP46_001284 [Phenoliferia psychrophenolica]